LIEMTPRRQDKAARETQLSDLKTNWETAKQHQSGVDRQATAELAVFQLQRKVGDTSGGNLGPRKLLDRAEQKSHDILGKLLASPTLSSPSSSSAGRCRVHEPRRLVRPDHRDGKIEGQITQLQRK